MGKAGDASVLSEKVIKLVQQHAIRPEQIEFCLVGLADQAIVALSDRLLVVKYGWQAGVPFGSKVTEFHYSDIHGVKENVRTGFIANTTDVEILAPGYPDIKTLQARNPEKSVIEGNLPNVITIITSEIATYRLYLDRLHAKIREARYPSTSTTSGTRQSLVGTELEKLLSLRKAGELTEEEFQIAKRKLLGLI